MAAFKSKEKPIACDEAKRLCNDVVLQIDGANDSSSDDDLDDDDEDFDNYPIAPVGAVAEGEEAPEEVIT